jgi:glycerophosphoryl diester phosphodiesterase
VRNAPYQAFQVPETAGRIRIVSPRFIRHVHEAGKRLQGWTIDEEADMQRLLAWGVDGLISNRPDIAVRVRDAFIAGRRQSRK